MGAITGMGMTMIIVVMWVFLGESIDSDSMISQLEDTGLTDVRLYIAGMIYWIFLNSLLELIDPAMVGRLVISPQCLDDLHTFIGSCTALGKRYSGRIELRWEIAADSDAKDQTAI